MDPSQAKALPLKDVEEYAIVVSHPVTERRYLIWSFLLGHYCKLSDAIRNFNSDDSDFDVPSFQKACSSLAHNYIFLNIGLYS